MCFDGESPRVFDVSEVRARKLHRCCECAEEIPKGARYERASGLWDGEWDAFTTCLRCARAREMVQEIEAAEGCHGGEAWCPFGHLAEYAQNVIDSIDRDFARALMAWAEFRTDVTDSWPTRGEWIDLFARVAPEERRRRIEERKAEETARKAARAQWSERWG